MGRVKWRALVGVGLAFAMTSATPALSKGIVRDGFSFPTEGRMKIAVFRPDVHVGSLRVGGLDEANAEWTSAARQYMQTALESAGEARASDMIFLAEPEGPNAEVLNRYRGLFEVVSAEVVTHQFLGDRLPTKLAAATSPSDKTKRYKLDWTLGPGAAELKGITGADYAMFLFTHDAYGDAGRKVAQLLLAGLFGAYVPAGVHIGYAGLVDLNTGNIVWFNTDPAMGGDVRQADGAAKRVAQLLAGLPTRGVPAGAIAPRPVPATGDQSNGDAVTVSPSAAPPAVPSAATEDHEAAHSDNQAS